MRVLGVDIGAELQERWASWLAPEVQPFFVESLRPWPSRVHRGALTPELENTYATWRIDRSLETLWLDEGTFFEMPKAQRAALVREQVHNRRGAVPSVRRWADLLDPAQLRRQADGHRFVFWPSLVASNADGVLALVIEASPDGAQAAGFPSRHAEVARSTWAGCADALPNVRRMGGTFAPWTGPNCFGTVMAAAGATEDTPDQMLQEPFDGWLHRACRPGGRDEDPGTVVVWRDRSGAPFHAAVTIGDGWVFEKASGEWWTPRAVRAVRDVIRASRSPGLHLERHRIAGGSTP